MPTPLVRARFALAAVLAAASVSASDAAAAPAFGFDDVTRWAERLAEREY
jgi:hypothetical protein